MDDVGEWVADVFTTVSFLLSLGRLRNDDDDDDQEILKKVERFSDQNDNFACASHFLLHLVAFSARPRHEISQLHGNTRR